MSKLIRKPTWALFFAHINFLVLIYCISFCFQKLISWFVAFSNSSQNSWIEKVYRLDCLNSDGKPTHLLNRIGLICCSNIRFWPFGALDTQGIRIAMLKYERICYCIVCPEILIKKYMLFYKSYFELSIFCIFSYQQWSINQLMILPYMW